MRSLRKITGLGILCIVLSACSYHLSGTQIGEKQRFPKVLQYISMQGLNRYDSFYSVMVSNLRGFGFKVTRRSSATAHLVFSDKAITERVHVVGADAQASEILLRIRFDVRVEGKDRSVLLERRHMQAESYYLNNPNRVLESRVLREHAQRKVEIKLAGRLLNQMASIRPKSESKSKSKS